MTESLSATVESLLGRAPMGEVGKGMFVQDSEFQELAAAVQGSKDRDALFEEFVILMRRLQPFIGPGLKLGFRGNSGPRPPVIEEMKRLDDAARRFMCDPAPQAG